MSTSPVTKNDCIDIAASDYQIVLPQFEYSKILDRLYKVAHRKTEFLNVCGQVFTVTYEHVFFFGSEKREYCFVCDGVAAELHVVFTDQHVVCTADFHEAWRAHNTTNNCTPFAANLEFDKQCVLVTASGTWTIDVQTAGQLKSLAFKPADKPHVMLLKLDGSTSLLNAIKPHTPANGQMWTMMLAPQRVMLSPFCPLRGWLCITCKHAFDTPLQMAQHCLRNPNLTTKDVVLNYVDCTGHIRMSSATMARYPIKQQARMSKYSFVGFDYRVLIQKLLSLRSAHVF